MSRHRETALRSVSPPQQARSAGTLRRILDAAESLIEQKGLADASLPEIVRRARSSVGGFYARFRDKNELLRALEERFFRDVEEQLAALVERDALADAPLLLCIEHCVALLLGVARAHPQLIAAFLWRTAQDAEGRAEAQCFRERVAARVAELLLRRREELGHPDPELAIDLAVQLAFGFVEQLVLQLEPRAGGRALSEERVRAELVRIFGCYLEVPASPRDRAPRRRP